MVLVLLTSLNCCMSTPSRTLRSSSDTRMLEIQQYERKTHGFRTFSCFGPHIWISLPQDLRHCSTLLSFKACRLLGWARHYTHKLSLSELACFLYTTTPLNTSMDIDGDHSPLICPADLAYSQSQNESHNSKVFYVSIWQSNNRLQLSFCGY